VSPFAASLLAFCAVEALGPPRSAALPGGLHNPMPGGTLAGYAADTGLDIAGSPRPVFALAAGTLDYSEAGHTLWTGPRDTPFTIRFELDRPISYGDHVVTHVYYGHLSRLAHVQHEDQGTRRHVEAGEYLGFSGVARGSPHLHVGLLLDADVSQAWGTFLSADEIRAVLGGLRNKTRLPGDPAAAIYERFR
jgi:murein DD-endopeptidase MepM/ murein hydrolase activator NlpD